MQSSNTLSKTLELTKIVGSNIYAARKRQNLTQEVLAIKLNMQRETISQIELGKRNISLNKLAQIGQVLNIEPFELLRPAYFDSAK